MNECCLIIFSKNPIPGKVKTRLAKAIGNDKALEVYRALLKHTRNITKHLDCQRVVYYSDFINCEDLWDCEFYGKKKQIGSDLGARMASAMEKQLEDFRRCVIIGTDCFELDEDTIKAAFEALNDHDAVIGPAIDGGYYLLGIKKMCTALFENKNWSTSTVFKDTIDAFEEHKLSYWVLPKMRDVDTVDDLVASEQLSNSA